MKFVIAAAFTALPVVAMAQTAPAPAPTPAPATAPATAAAAPKVGATVTGKDGQPAGTIAQVTAEAVVVDTGTNKVPVPPTSIGSDAKGATIAMTKAELDAAYAQAAQQAQASFASQLTAGKTVQGAGGQTVGTIKAADAQFVTVTTAKGDVKLPIAGFGPGPDGTVRVGATVEQIDAALAGSATPGG